MCAWAAVFGMSTATVSLMVATWSLPPTMLRADTLARWYAITVFRPKNLTHTYWIRRALPAASMRMTGSSKSWIVTHAPIADTHIDVTMAAVCSQCWVVKPSCQSSRVPCSTWYTVPHTLQRRESGVEELSTSHRRKQSWCTLLTSPRHWHGWISGPASWRSPS